MSVSHEEAAASPDRWLKEAVASGDYEGAALEAGRLAGVGPLDWEILQKEGFTYAVDPKLPSDSDLALSRLGTFKDPDQIRLRNAAAQRSLMVQWEVEGIGTDAVPERLAFVDGAGGPYRYAVLQRGSAIADRDRAGVGGEGHEAAREAANRWNKIVADAEGSIWSDYAAIVADRVGTVVITPDAEGHDQATIWTDDIRETGGIAQGPATPTVLAELAAQSYRVPPEYLPPAN